MRLVALIRKWIGIDEDKEKRDIATRSERIEVLKSKIDSSCEKSSQLMKKMEATLDGEYEWFRPMHREDHCVK
jgi:hypothetical protein